jgi:hypothetical protein
LWHYFQLVESTHRLSALQGEHDGRVLCCCSEQSPEWPNQASTMPLAHSADQH